ncbi:HAD-like domain-containing protein [Cristinia sonorae]|uniref:HAD-like domain-containing protein n=1 Tax=Cristinia sonorae TaxID=1940300 RepID=A0A8K0UW32_9AGAR|nr:HAD-like domain-containing protein [Cristinia sonorae]
MPVTTIHFDAILFDMDGTLVDSTDGVVGAWQTFAQTYPGIDVEDILSSAHGVRTVENLRRYCGVTDPDELEAEAVRFEEAIVQSASLPGRKGIVQLPGVKEAMRELLPGRKLPHPCWAICTSATRKYATSALTASGIPIPDVFIAAEDVTEGKPKPDPYLKGAEGCGVDPRRCLVVEDAPNGIRSGKSAGCKTLALTTTHSKEQVQESEPDYIVENLSSVSFKRAETGGVDVTINHD